MTARRCPRARAAVQHQGSSCMHTLLLVRNAFVLSGTLLHGCNCSGQCLQLRKLGMLMQSCRCWPNLQHIVL